MEKQFRKSSLLRGLLSLLLLVTMVGNAWGADETLTITGASSGNNAPWGTSYATGTGTSTTSASTSIGISYTNVGRMNTGIQIKANTSNCFYSTTCPTNKVITSIAMTKKTNNFNYQVSTDGSSWTTVETISATSTKNYNTSDGYKYFKISATSSYTVLTSVVVTYSDAVADTRTAVNMSTFTTAGGVTSIVKGNTLATSVTNDQSGWTAAYTYSSSNESVATVAADGTITAVAKGTAKIKAALNVDKDDATYKAGTTTYKEIEITVTNPTHHYTFSANGTTFSEGDVEEGSAITFPANKPADVSGMAFVGWYAGDYSNATTAPTYVSSATMGENDVTYKAVYASTSLGGTGYKLVSSLTEGKKYIFVTRNTAGSGYALASTVTTGTSVTVATSGDDKVISGTPANSIVWTRGAQYDKISGSFDLQNVGTSTVHLKINGTAVTTADASYPTFWDSSKGLYGKSSTGTGSTSYYLLNSNGTFSKGTGSTTNRVYAYEEYTATSYSDYTTTVAVKTMHHLKVTGYKSLYKVGQTFDATNMVVTLSYDENETDTKDVTAKATVDKTTALTTSNATWRVSYTENNNTVNKDIDIDVVALDHITVTNTENVQLVYCEGENFDKTNLTASATWGTVQNKTITDDNVAYTITDGENLAAGKTFVTLSYTHEGTTKTTTQAITVRTVDITASTVEGGSYTVKVGDADAVTASGAKINAKKDQKIVLVPTPSEGYKLASKVFTVTDEDGANVTVSTTSGYSFTMPGKSVTVKASFSKLYTIATTTPENGTITSIKDKDGNDITSTSAQSTVWVTVTPDTHYTLSAISVKKADESTVNVTVDPENANRASFTMPQSNVTVSATFAEDPKHNVTFSVNGVAGDPTPVYEGDAVVFPAKPADLYGKKFMGWASATIEGTQETAPAFVTEATMSTQDLTYYAVFATTIPGEDGSVDFTVSSISSLTTGANQRTQTAGDITFTFSSVADVNQSGTHYVQLSKSSTLTQNAAFSGSIKKISFEGFGYSSTSDASMVVSGKKGVDGDYATVQSCTGTYSGADIDFSGNDYNMLKIEVGSGRTVKFTKMTVAYSSTSYSDYRTTVPSTATITLNAACHDTDGMVYGTYSNSSAWVVSNDIVVSEVGLNNEGKLNVQSYSTGAVVPANTGVMVSASAGGDYTVNLSNETGTSVLGNDNLLRPTGAGITATQMVAKDPDCLYYRLTMHKGTQIGFYWGAAEGAAFDLGANKAYLAVPKDSSAKINGMWFGDNDTDGIEAVAASQLDENAPVYNLAGQRVSHTTKGIVIQNGKKYINK